MSLEKLWYKVIATLFGLTGAGFALIGAAIVVGQTVTWLKHAIWEQHTIGDALHDWGVPALFMPNMLGVQKILDHILSWPSIVGYIVLAIGCFAVAGWAGEQLSSIESKEREAQRQREYAEREKEIVDIAREEAARSKAGLRFSGAD